MINTNISSFNDWKKQHKQIKECVLFVSKGHDRFQCPTLTRDGTPLSDKNLKSRQK